MTSVNKRAADVAIWLLLLTMPYWLDWIGGYTSLGSRVQVLALAAMSLSFLLGFTGVLSFGHAAYFGLGAYGVGLTIKYLVPSTLAGMAVGVITGTIAAAIIGALIVRLRGIYFAMVTIAFGQVFYFIAYRWNSVTGGDDGLSGWQRLPIDLGIVRFDILGSDTAFYYWVLICFAIAVGIMAALLRSPFWPHLVGDPRKRAARAFLGIPVERHIWLSWVISCVFAHPPIAQDKKLTIVLIEHDMRVVFHLADRITMLAEGTPQEIAANEAVQAAYLGEAAA